MNPTTALRVALLVSTALAVPTWPRRLVPPDGFKNCIPPRATGDHDIRREEMGYFKKLDRDGDSVPCQEKRQ